MSRPSSRAWYFSIRSFTSSSHLPSSCTPHKANDLLNEVRILSTSGHIDQALSLFYNASLPPLPYSEQTYTALFHACARHGYLQQGINLHQHLLSNNNNSNHELGVFVTNHLINMYAKCGSLNYARQLFDEMPDRNVVSWTALISGYAQHGHVYECCSLFSCMLKHCQPNEFAFTSNLTCCDYVHGKQVHGLAMKMGLDGTVYVGNALISMYGNNGDINEAWTVFQNLKIRNIVSWNSMIAGFQVRKLGAQALHLFSQMHRNGIGFDRATLLSVLSSLTEGCIHSHDVGWDFCFQLHCLSIKSSFLLQVEVVTAFVKAYSDLGGEVTDCYSLFLESSCCRDIVAWTGIITACSERQPEEALFLFRQLRREYLAPDWYTFSSVLKACAGLGTERHAMVIHSLVVKAGFEGDAVLDNALIHAYTRCGSISLSKQVFDEMGSRNLVSWNSMLKAYALHGQAKEALHVFSEMNVRPDSATLVALLSACSHSGLVEKGIEIFESMSVNHGIFPQVDHYACMVDILGRAGRVVEANELISRMPMKPDSVVWSALLGSCRKHGETHLAKLAADRLKELEPRNSLGYIQMSNIYCSGGSYTEAGVIRNEMAGSRVRKEPGLSWIEIGNRVHEFASGGRRHPQRQAICTRLDVLIGQLKEIGYMPETSSAIHDIEEEHKEEQLYHHSEKLALVFAVMNEESQNCGRSVLKIMKNIRICVDCHTFMKLASYLLCKEIVVRDSNRFHQFKNGICSCSDYW
ncbi:pentatricopeptide repeat-containing protein At1g71420 [Mercurialis annua]|uniref:pentatricopeptide repeat-containing protein At1g71420 n=1 Tax=Mercurialis annua TaxID=3986 RepID=UPI00215F82F0|nr:pentatricopeptide repeat-containing protein At1g71420 [Mercurialis annua]